MTRLITLLTVIALAQQPGRPAATPAGPAGQLHEVVVHGPSLEKNLVGVAADRTVSIYLPPSYATSTRRYPVLVVLHGILDSNRTWTRPWDDRHPGFATIQDVMDRGIAAGRLQEMIVVVPDADKSCHYRDSPVKGGWASFIAKDLVAYVDATYRTIASPQARGVMGHSMGGHGAIKIAMTHPGVFSAVYALNPSLLGWGGDVSPDNTELMKVASLTSPADLAQAGFYARAVVGIGQCFSPDPSSPLLTAFPFRMTAAGEVEMTPAHDQWTAQMPVYTAPHHAAALKALRGLAFDSAYTDEFTHIPPTSRALSSALDAAGIPHTFEMYDGDHRNRLWGADGRIFTVALPFFSRLFGDVAGLAAGASVTPRPLAGGPPAASTADAQSRLWDAVIAGDLTTAAQAVAAGADVNALDTRTNQNGRRPLNHAAEHNRADMIRWLVAQGADVNATNATGFTPLHHAAEFGSAAAAEALLALGANPKAALRSGSTPLDLARQRGKTDVVRILEKIR